MSATQEDHPGVIAYPPLIFLGCLLVGLVFHWLLPWPLSPSRPLRILGAGLALTAAVLVSSASRTMRRAGTNVRPDKPSTAIVTTGPFRFTRNPMYLSLCLLNTGIALLLCSFPPLLMTIVLICVLHCGVILREEKYLAAKFGPAYLNYQKSVRRWL